MKVTTEDYNRLQSAIVDMPAEASERERWDALWRAVDSGRIGYDIFKPYHDSHIDTALRRIAGKGK
jgi:hypothetical protein